MGLLDGKIAKQVAKALKAAGLTQPATLHVITPGARTSASGGANPTTTTHAARGFVESYDSRHIDGTIVKADDVRVSLLAATIAGGAVPAAGHKITIGGTTYRVIAVQADPAKAVYQCQCRKGG